MFEAPALETLSDRQFTLSSELIEPNYLILYCRRSTTVSSESLPRYSFVKMSMSCNDVSKKRQYLEPEKRCFNSALTRVCLSSNEPQSKLSGKFKFFFFNQNVLIQKLDHKWNESYFSCRWNNSNPTYLLKIKANFSRWLPYVLECVRKVN